MQKKEHIDAIVPMAIIEKMGEWAKAQYFEMEYGETFIVNTNSKYIYYGYPTPDDEELKKDWEKLTSQ